MKVRISAGELIERKLWTAVCDETGLSEWAVNEGQMDRNEEITLTREQAVKVGLLRKDAP